MTRKVSLALQRSSGMLSALLAAASCSGCLAQRPEKSKVRDLGTTAAFEDGPAGVRVFGQTIAEVLVGDEGFAADEECEVGPVNLELVNDSTWLESPWREVITDVRSSPASPIEATVGEPLAVSFEWTLEPALSTSERLCGARVAVEIYLQLSDEYPGFFSEPEWSPHSPCLPP